MFPVQNDVLPPQGVHVAQPQAAIAGEKIGTLHVLTRTLRVNQHLYLVNGQVFTLGFRHLDAFRGCKCHDRVFRDDLRTDGGIEGGGEVTHVVRRALGGKRLAPPGFVGMLNPVDKIQTPLLVDFPHPHLFPVKGKHTADRPQQFQPSCALALLFGKIGFHPVVQQHSGTDGCLFQSGLRVGQFDDAS